MESLHKTPDSQEDEDSPREGAALASRAALCVRIWDYPGPQQELRNLDWGANETLADLIRNVVGEGQGRVCEVGGNTLVAQFDNPFNALSAAKSLQVRLLTFHRGPQEAQIVAAAMVRGESKPTSSPPMSIATAGALLAEGTAAQILVSENIYAAAKVVPGFQFSAKATRQADESSEALYELLWTDESTYSHIRKAGQTGAVSQRAANRYQIQSELGRGAMGVVYKAHDQVIGRTVALKTILIQRNFAEGEEMVERLKQEAKAAGGLDHPNIITIYDVGQQEGFVYLSMQFVEGRTLAGLLTEGKLPFLTTLLAYADQMCGAVGFAHQRGVIHRDLKPANFMLTADGTIKVLDFGIAKFGDANMTQTGVVVGTPTYMAPEQVSGKKLDHRSDIFALGTVFYELFTREKPFKGDIPAVLYKLVHEDPVPPSIINPSLPNGVDAVIRKALQKDPKNRYQSCEEMREAFRQQAELLKATEESRAAAVRVTDSSAALPRPTSSAQDLLAEIDPARSHRPVWIGLVAALLLAAAGVGAWAFRVKSRTGYFPPALSKTLAATGLAKKMALRSQPKAPSSAEQPLPQTAGASSSTTPVTESGSSVASAPSGTADVPGVTPEVSSPKSGSTSTPTSVDNSAGKATSVQSSAPAAAPADIAQNAQSAGDHAGETKSTIQSSANNPDGAEDKPANSLPAKATKRTAKGASAASVENESSVEGFTRSEIPALLRKADAAAGAGDYSLARYEYNIILRLDHQNAAARTGLARVLAAKAEKLQH